MTRPAPLSTDNLLRFLHVTDGGANLWELQRGLKLSKSEVRPLLRILAKLKKRKAILELADGRFTLPSQRPERQNQAGQAVRSGQNRSAASGPSGNSFPGRLILHQDGYGFAVPDRPMPQLDRDVFIPREAVGDAMHGDHVEIQLGRVTPGAAGQRAKAAS